MAGARYVKEMVDQYLLGSQDINYMHPMALVPARRLW